MLIRGQTTEERIAGIAKQFANGIDGFTAGMKMETDANNLAKNENIRAEALRRQQALDAQNQANSAEDRALRRAEFGINQELKSAQVAELKLPFDQTRDYKKAVKMAEVQGSARSAADAARIENKKNQKISEVAINDFDFISPDIIPTQKDAEEVKKFNASNKNYQQIGNRLASRLESLKNTDRTGVTNAYKLIEQDLTQMALQAKELANLGVLNGPDLELVNKDLGSINLSSLNTLGADAAIGRLKSALGTAQNKLGNLSNARGYAPRAGAIDKNSVEYKQNRLKELLAKQQAGV